MALFQSTVFQKYLKAQNNALLHDKWEAYKSHFHNPSIQENIRNAKEEQYQEGFLRDLFVNILGYTLNPDTDFNLTTELKNVKDAKKADGGIMVNEKVVGVIELKGTNTTDLSKVESQAFGYKVNQPHCNYVITSNFEKLRFYVDNAIEHIAFDLFQLTEDEFKLLYLCLAYENIRQDIPKKLKSESLSQEDVITKQLYKDYSLFKRELFNNLTALNPTVEPLLLFKKSQKLLDRFLFLFFAEDRHLLPPNSVRLILKQWKQLKELDAYTPLFDRFKKYFGYLNTGHKGKKYDVYPYNGGLFKPDDILDNIKIDDDLLYQHTLKLSEYDFDSEVDVNILGHIFENSLNEIEEIQTQLEENPQEDVKISKRKKDGVFYTPKYITKYIVENTVGKLCEEQKEKRDIAEEEYTINRQKKTKEKLLKKLKDYRDWLLQLTIVDPACGSGAFLNEALNYLIAEHQYLDELETKLMGGGFVFPNVENSILEHNLYGVDINNESVEIAKLSLWLRTAQPNRKLNDLSNNIKCGNSLIDDPDVAGDKAFHWETEFPNVFKEKDKRAYHITTALHDSRTSKRMIDYKVREKRDGGTNPYPNYKKLTAEEEVLITEEVLHIVKEDKLQILAFNVCADHMHLLLVCEEEDIPKIMQKIKAKTARKVNIHKGITIPSTKEQASNHIPTKEHAPLPSQKRKEEHAPLPSQKRKEEYAPLPQRGKKQNSLWTQKYGCKPITDETQLHNTIKYIQNNRSKHHLPESQNLNKLIDDLCCTTDVAFAPEYKGGFDVVIGNPPYVRQELFSEIKPYLKEHYLCFNSVADLYTYFVEKGIELINDNGIFSYILPNKFLKASYGKEIRKVISSKSNIISIYDFDDYPVFQEATTYPIIFVVNKNFDNDLKTFKFSEISNRSNASDPIHQLKENEVNVNKPLLNEENWQFQDVKTSNLVDKLKSNSTSLKVFVNDKIFRGVSTGRNEVFIIDEKNYNELVNEKNKDYLRKIVTGKEVKRNSLVFDNLYLLFIPWEYDLEFDENIKNYLLKNKDILSSRPEVKKGRFNWWCLSRYGSKNSEYLFKSKIIYPRINNECNFYYDQSGEFSLSDNNFFISTEKKFLLPILNSKLTFFYLKTIASTLQGGYLDFRRPYIETIPIRLPKNENYFIKKTDIMLELNKVLLDIETKFQRSLKREFPEALEKLPKKLQNWYELSFADFVKELKKKKIKLSLSQKAEWEDYFLAEQQKALDLQAQINATDAAIDQMVYELYGLTEEEIKIVENS
ncbi:Eco57I restriction-modification methylase domain-containing protein [Flavobacteriaceae bacterium 14752]|uniref:Eco57I restriction-modification methylase domain-containing protein n=1 Tax=Mesohalobacter salilacus TaxID=2491711 RepID=UPI000F62EC0B|nr:hypothetical protein EIG84_12100 [Flavobacteriaceae bacterium 14752]